MGARLDGGRLLVDISCRYLLQHIIRVLCYLHVYICIHIFRESMHILLGTHMSSWTFWPWILQRGLFQPKIWFFLRFLGILQYILEYGIWPICKYFQEVCVFPENRVMWPMWMFSNPGLSGLSSLISWWWINDSCTKGNLGNAHLEALGLKKKWSSWRRT